jgi:hypothetical protein
LIKKSIEHAIESAAFDDMERVLMKRVEDKQPDIRAIALELLANFQVYNCFCRTEVLFLLVAMRNFNNKRGEVLLFAETRSRCIQIDKQLHLESCTSLCFFEYYSFGT